MNRNRNESTHERLAKIASNAATLRTNLYNAGLTMAGCDVAYRAAMFAGADAEQAFEAARQHMLVEMLPREVNTHTQLAYSGANTYNARAGRPYTTEMHAARLAQMDAVRALPNPFAAGAYSHELPLQVAA